MSDLVESYRMLVGVLLDHTHIDHEGTSPAIADFLASDDRAADILRALLIAQNDGKEPPEGVGDEYWLAGPGS